MFSRSKKKSSTPKKTVTKLATATIIKPEEKKATIITPAIDLSKAQITIIEPDTGLRIQVEEEEED